MAAELSNEIDTHGVFRREVDCLRDGGVPDALRAQT